MHDFTCLSRSRYFSRPKKDKFRLAVTGKNKNVEGIFFYEVEDKVKHFRKKGKYTILGPRDKSTFAVKEGNIFQIADYHGNFKKFTRRNPYLVDRLVVLDGYPSWVVAVSGKKLCLWEVK